MKNGYQATAGASGSAVISQQGELSIEGGSETSTQAEPPSPTPAYRLRRSIETFQAATGDLYLLHAGTGEEFMIEEPSDFDLALLSALRADFVSERDLEHLSAGAPAGVVSAAVKELCSLDLLERAPSVSLLNAKQRERYDRQLIYFADLAPAGSSAEGLQSRLGSARVVILGCGGLGSWTACGLASAGIGALILIDPDSVELSNLNRQLLFAEADLGRLKVEVAAKALRRYNSDLMVETHALRIDGPTSLECRLKGADLLVATADSPPTSLPRWVNEACLSAGTPYVSAGQSMPLVRVGPFVVPGQTACHSCSERRWAAEFPHYQALAEQRELDSPPAATFGAASGLVGSMLAMEAVHFLTGVVQPASLSTALMMDLRSMELWREESRPDRDCPQCRGLDH